MRFQLNYFSCVELGVYSNDIFPIGGLHCYLHRTLKVMFQSLLTQVSQIGWFRNICPLFIINMNEQGPVSTSDKTSYLKISCSLEAARLAVSNIASLWNLTDTSAVVLRSDYSKYKYRGFKTSRDLTIRRLIAYWNGAQPKFHKIYSSVRVVLLLFLLV